MGTSPEPALIGRGHAARTEDTARRHAEPSFYADPAAWLAVEAVAVALGDAPVAVADAAEDTGVLAVSAMATTSTVRAIRRGAARGRVSPLRFAGANPGSLAGLVCIRYGFRGPSLTLSMPPDEAWPVPAIRRTWLAGPCRFVVVVEHSGGPDGPESARATIYSGEPR